ncbi:MAG TPA: hypothetical protein VM166_14150 [Gemmatimonadaceae bacterium]|nr:hypothetical protein [Gemmatimonadaceae bacterium]
MRGRWRRRIVLAVVFSVGCARENAEPGTGESAKTQDVHRPGNRFDPGTTQSGAKIGELVVDSISAQRALAADSSWVGTARFKGTIALDGTLMRHPDPDVRDVCLEVDSASASKLPRWDGDTRRAWFCFSNGEEARRLLSAKQGPVRILVDQFTINRGLSDQVNTARLVSGATK